MNSVCIRKIDLVLIIGSPSICNVIREQESDRKNHVNKYVQKKEVKKEKGKKLMCHYNEEVKDSLFEIELTFFVMVQKEKCDGVRNNVF